MDTRTGRGVDPVRYHRSRSMADSSTLNLTPRTPEGSRATRRLRRRASCPASSTAAAIRALRGRRADPAQHARPRGADHRGGARGRVGSNVLIKDVQRHPCAGQAVHVDLLRVRMDEKIHATVPLEFTGAEEAPGVVEGGIFNQELRELDDRGPAGRHPGLDQLRRLRPRDERHADARCPHRAERRRAARRCRGRHRHDHSPDPRAGRGGDRDRDRGRRRGGRGGRGAGRGRHRRGGHPAGRLGRERISSAPHPSTGWSPGSATRAPATPPPRTTSASVSRRRSPSAGGSASRGRSSAASWPKVDRPGGPRVAILLPQTYMNESGRSVGPARGAFKLDLDRSSSSTTRSTCRSARCACASAAASPATTA